MICRGRIRHLLGCAIAAFLFIASLLVVCLASSPAAFAQVESVTSPDGSLVLSFELDGQGQPWYSVTRFGAPLLNRSRLGVVIANDAPLSAGLTVERVSRNQVDLTWTQVWGESARVRDNHNELSVALTDGGSAPRTMIVVFRVFDDGFGFRYEWPDQPNLGAFEITDELTQFAFAGDHNAWWIPAFEYQRYEYLYEKNTLSQLGVVHTPLTMETSDGLFLSVHEAALTDYASMALKHTGGASDETDGSARATRTTTLQAELVPWSDGIKVRVQVPHVSPWRTVIVADTPGELITSNLVLNLNEPNVLEDVSWIKPGKYVGVWWAMHLGIASWGTGPTHGATTTNVRRYIDFAAEHGFDGVLVEGWNVGWDGPWAGDGEGFSFTDPVDDFDMVGLSDYAIANGVRLIGHHENGGGVENYERQLDDALAYYNEHGVTAVKSGYVEWAQDIKRTLPDGRRVGEWHHGQFMVRHYRKVVEEMAAHRIMLDVHEPIKPTGIRRTYPNMMTREGARGQEYNSTWGGGNGLDHNVILPFTRLLAGPMDFTPGIFDLDGGGEGPENAVASTLAHQLALYVVRYWIKFSKFIGKFGSSLR